MHPSMLYKLNRSFSPGRLKQVYLFIFFILRTLAKFDYFLPNYEYFLLPLYAKKTVRYVNNECFIHTDHQIHLDMEVT